MRIIKKYANRRLYDTQTSAYINLEGLADEMYQQDISGLPGFELFDMVSVDGQAFPGFSADGTWILALRCTTCINPAPPYLGVLEYVE